MAQPRKKDDPYPYPFPCEFFPKFETRHEAAALIAEFQRKGRVKKCAYADVERIGGSHQTPRFTPRCHKDSFLIAEPDRDRLPRWSTEFARRYFLGCPPDCLYFEPAWKGKAREWWAWAWWPFRRNVVGIGQWFASLNGVVQVVLLLVILLILAGAPLLNAVTELLKVIYGR